MSRPLGERALGPVGSDHPMRLRLAFLLAAALLSLPARPAAARDRTAAAPLAERIARRLAQAEVRAGKFPEERKAT